MNEEAKEEIRLALELLKGVLVKHGVSIALYSNKIAFFDTDTYIKEHKFSGIDVVIDNLVK